MHYKHTQIGHVTISAGLVGLAVVYYSFMAEYGELGIFGLALMGFFAALTVLFATLTTEIAGRTFQFYFGPGFWTREFLLEDIRSAEVVRNAVWHGWGIRYIFHGWLYNVSGLWAVELDIRGEGTIRVGTDEPEALKEALDRALQTA